jgi:sulfatase modifying factor 1
MRKLLILISVLSALLISCGDPKARQPLVDASLNEMLYVPGGTYSMGSEKVGQWVHPVTLRSFYISKDNVSYQKYDWYTKASGRSKIDSDDISIFRQENYPVDYITWYQANDYCEYLAKISGLPYDLPTQEQWEYVARNNGKPDWDFPTNNGKQELGVNFPSYDQLKNQKKGTATGAGPLPIGSIPCTPQGICGLTGAVNEWTKDAQGSLRVLRGGGANGSPEFANAYGHDAVDPNDTNGGFRCVINSDKPMSELRAIAMQHLNRA